MSAYPDNLTPLGREGPDLGIKADILVSLSANEPPTGDEEAAYEAFLRADLQRQVDGLLSQWIDGIRAARLLWILDEETIQLEVPPLRLRRRSEAPRLAEVVALEPEERAELSERTLIVVILRERGQASPAEIREELGRRGVNKGANAVQQFVLRMFRAGEIRRVRRGIYAPLEDPGGGDVAARSQRD